MNIKIVKLVSLILAITIFSQFSCSNSDNRFPTELPLQGVVIYGDTRTGHSTHQEVVDNIIKTQPVAVFHTGDLVGDGSNPEDWAVFNNIVFELTKTTEFYPALGNHERDSQLFFDNFNLPNNERWYSVEINDIHFIVLDSNSDISKYSEQYEWLEADLQTDSDNILFTVAVFHHPPFSIGHHIDDEKGFRQTVVPLFEQYGVDVVFSGHNHAYERFLYNDICYVVTGGGGAPLYGKTRTSPYNQTYVKSHHFCVLYRSDDYLCVDVFDINLNIIDSFSINGYSQKSSELSILSQCAK